MSEASKGLPRRNVLQLGVLAIAAIAASPYKLSNIDPDAQEPERKFTPTFKDIGPPIERLKTGRGPGERSGLVDPDDSGRVIVGTWDDGNWVTTDGGKKWEKQNIPVVQKEGREYPVARDMQMVPATKEIVVAFDYSLAIGSFDSSNWKLINLPDFWQSKTSEVQTLCILPDGKMLIGGNADFPHSGLAVYDPKTDVWSPIDGLATRESSFLIRTIEHAPSLDGKTPGKIFIGGWATLDNDGTVPGTGLICIDDKNFKIISEYSHTLDDDRGPMSINTIRATRYKDREILFVGGEGPGKVNQNRKFDPTRPQFRILINNVEVSQEIVNSKGLAETGGWAFAAPQRGIAVVSDEVYFSTGFREISSASLKPLLQQKKLNWERITKPESEDEYSGSMHLGLSRNKISGNPALAVFRGKFKKGTLFPFLQTQMADLGPEGFDELKKRVSK